jgi:hypothetical protein
MAKVNILEGPLGSSTRIQLTGITGATTEAERADVVFPVHAADGSCHRISIRGKNIRHAPVTLRFFSGNAPHDEFDFVDSSSLESGVAASKSLLLRHERGEGGVGCFRRLAGGGADNGGEKRKVLP